MAQFSATTPAILLDQVGRMPFSNYVIQSNETSVTGAIANSCVQLPEAPSSVVVHHCGILCLPLQCSMVFGCGMNYFTMSIQFLKCKLQLMLLGATQGS